MGCTVYWLSAIGKGRIGIMPRPRGGDWLEDDIASLASQGVDILVSLLTSEEVQELDLGEESRICGERGLGFRSFPINDRDVPTLNSALKDFVRGLRSQTATGKSIVVHCRVGIGRAAIIAACLMVSPTNPVEQVMSLISEARGLSVPDTNAQLQWVQSFADWSLNEHQ